jgi:hypothetical protein
MNLLKQLSDSKLIEPIWVSIESKDENYQLKIKENLKNRQLENFCSTNNLKIEEQNGYWLISKP